MNNRHFIRVGHVLPFIESMETIGMPLDSILLKNKMHREWLYKPEQLIPEYLAWQLLEAPKDLEGIDDFGFEVTQSNSFENYGDFGRAIMSAKTVYEAIQAFIYNMPSQTTAPPFWVERDQENLWFCREGLQECVAGSQQVEQHVLGLMVQVVRLSPSSKTWCPNEVRVQNSSLCHATNSDFLTNSTIAYHSQNTAIAIPIKLLDSPIKRSHSLSAGSVIASIPSELHKVIEDVLVYANHAERFNLEHISNFLDMQPRQLQRALRLEDTSFREIAGRVRLTQAKNMLLDPNFSVADIALELGYTDQANFWRAFVRGTGVSPTEYKQLHLKL